MDELIKSIKKIKFYADAISRLCEKCLENPARIAPSVRNELMRKTEEYSLSMYYNAEKVSYPPEVDKRILQRYDYFNDFTEILQVDEDCIHFRVPLLPSKRGKQQLAAYATSYVFHSIIDQFGAVPIMPKHTIEFTHVYPTSDEDKVLDHDNYEISKTINVIMIFIKSSDKGTNSWSSFRTIISDELTSGTYVKITRRN